MNVTGNEKCVIIIKKRVMSGPRGKIVVKKAGKAGIYRWAKQRIKRG